MAMRIIFSRKGFDQGSGGAPSPIVDGRPISLPIPAEDPPRSYTTYDDLGLGAIVEKMTKGKIQRNKRCHHDPMFEGERCAFGQVGAARSHLKNQGVGKGDVFLFFGLFADEAGKGNHHRIFGYLKVEEIIELGKRPSVKHFLGFPDRHPHTIGVWENENNAVYIGPGVVARHASDELRLTADNEKLSVWRVPPWLHKAKKLSYHNDKDRWLDGNLLQTVGRGQEFVAHIDEIAAARTWLNGIIDEIER